MAPQELLRSIGAQAEALLASPDLKDKTWGSYLAGRHDRKEHVPALERVLEPQPFGSPWQRSLLLRSAFDALIHLKAGPEAELLLPHFEAFPDEVLILLSHDPEQNQEPLLALLERPLNHVHWKAIGNMLAGTRAPGFATYLLRDLRVRVDVQVRDNPLAGAGHGSSGGCVWRRGPTRGSEIPADYPPVASYHLFSGNHPESGTVVLALGPYPIYYRRFVSQPGEALRVVPPLTVAAGWPDREKFRYLAALFPFPVEYLPLQETVNRSIDWLGPDAFQQAVARIRREVEALHAQLLVQLQERALLTAVEAATLSLELEFRVHDIRGDQSEPVPRIPSR